MAERVVVAIITPKEGKAARLEEILTNMTKSVQANEPGALRYHLHKQIESDNPELVVIETYKDKDSHLGHRETDDFKAMFKAMTDEGLLAGPPRIVATHSVAGFESR